VQEGVLTCQWHNWKFDLASGDCRFGGEPVRRYPTRVVAGRVELDLAVEDGRTVLVFTQVLPTDEGVADVAMGWHWYLDRLDAELRELRGQARES
jgi:hypothetical protein